MPSDREYRRFVLRLVPNSRPKADREMSSRESLDTLMIGVLSTSLGIVIVVEFFRQEPSLPTSVFVLITSVGVCLGIAGNLLARGRGRIMSPLSTLGTIVCLVSLALVSILVSMVLLPLVGMIVLPIYAALTGMEERAIRNNGRC